MKKSKIILCCICVCIYTGMFIFNYLTPMVADDFTYIHSFSTFERITSISQIFPSMLYHAKLLNGRIVAHFFLQLFDYLPSIIFDLVNSFVFLGLILLMYFYLSNSREENSLNLVQKIISLCSIFFSIWVFSLSFGQSYLWMAGSCNYLWAIVAGLLYLLPYIGLINDRKKKTGKFMQILFVVFAIFAGAWSENISFSIIFLAVVCVILAKFLYKEKIELYHISGIISAFAGFLTMALAPAEFSGKVGNFSISAIIRQFREALNEFAEFKILIFIFIVLLFASIYYKANQKNIITSVVFLLGALSSNFIMTFAKYYSDRSATCVGIFLLLANGILLISIFDKIRIISRSAIAILTVVTVYWGIIGSIDIYNSYSQIKENESYIIDCKATGKYDIEIPNVRTHSKYFPEYIVDTNDPSEWPNYSIAEYYGVNSILGYDVEME